VRRLARRPALALAAALAFAGGGLGLAGCGADYPDLLVIARSGSLPGARLGLLINDGGTVRCNGGRARMLPSELLIEARELVTDLGDEAERDLVLPRPPRALLRYRLRMQAGTVTFSDVDANGRPALGRVVALTRSIARDVCGLTR
jgi:hypothetical protein